MDYINHQTWKFKHDKWGDIRSKLGIHHQELMLYICNLKTFKVWGIPLQIVCNTWDPDGWDGWEPLKVIPQRSTIGRLPVLIFQSV